MGSVNFIFTFTPLKSLCRDRDGKHSWDSSCIVLFQEDAVLLADSVGPFYCSVVLSKGLIHHSVSRMLTNSSTIKP